MRRVFLVIVPLALMLAGCAKPEAPFLGKWQLSADSAPKTGDAKRDAAAAEMAKGFTLEFKSDKTAVLTAFGQTQAATFTVAAKVITITMTPSTGTKTGANDKPVTLTLSDDGKTLDAAPQNGSPELKFTKASS